MYPLCYVALLWTISLSFLKSILVGMENGLRCAINSKVVYAMNESTKRIYAGTAC